MTTQIERVFGHSVQHFEICDNLRHQINKKLAKLDSNPPQLEPAAQQQVEEEPTTTGEQNVSISPEAGFVTDATSTNDNVESVNPGNESSTIATNTIDTKNSSTTVAEGPNNQPNCTNTNNNDESLYEEEQTMISPNQQTIL